MVILNLCKRCWGFLSIFCISAVAILSTSAPTYGLATSYSYGVASIGVGGPVEVTYEGTGYSTSSFSSSNFDGWSEDYSEVGAFVSYTALEEGLVSVSLGDYGGILELQTTRVGEYAAGEVTVTVWSSGAPGGPLLIENYISDINSYFEWWLSGINMTYFQYWEYLEPGQSGYIDVSVSCYSRTYSPPVPEPATMLLLGSGLIGLAGYGRKKFFKK